MKKVMILLMTVCLVMVASGYAIAQEAEQPVQSQQERVAEMKREWQANLARWDDKAKAQLVPKAEKGMNDVNTKIVAMQTTYLDNLEKVMVKIEERLEVKKGMGGDTAVAESAVEMARASLDKAKVRNELQGKASYHIRVTTEGETGTFATASYSKMSGTLYGIQGEIDEAKTKMLEAVTALKAI